MLQIGEADQKHLSWPQHRIKHSSTFSDEKGEISKTNHTNVGYSSPYYIDNYLCDIGTIRA